MTQNSLSKAYLSNPKLNESFQSAVSAAADALELLCSAHNDNLSEVVNLATNLINEIGNRYIHTALDCYVDEFISTLGNSIAQSAISTSNKFVKEVLKDFPTSSSFVSDED